MMQKNLKKWQITKEGNLPAVHEEMICNKEQSILILIYSFFRKKRIDQLTKQRNKYIAMIKKINAKLDKSLAFQMRQYPDKLKKKLNLQLSKSYH